MGRYTLPPLAQRDPDKIWNYTAQRWSIDQAEIYTRQLGQHIETVAAQPEIGRACPEVRAGSIPSLQTGPCRINEITRFKSWCLDQ